VKFSMLVLIVLLALVAMFAIQNPGIVTVRFMNLSGQTSILVVIVAAFAVGVVGAGLAGIPGQLRRRSEAAAARQRARELEEENRTLKEETRNLKAGIDGLKKTGGGTPGGPA
jgi:uncharacterized integral membrane protein